MYWSCSRKVCKFYIFFYIFGFIKKEPHECCDIVSSPDMKHLKDHIMLDFEKDVDILITETGEIELNNDDKIIEL